MALWAAAITGRGGDTEVVEVLAMRLPTTKRRPRRQLLLRDWTRRSRES